MQKSNSKSVLYIGGFSSSKSLVKKVGTLLHQSLDSNTKTVTFSWAIKHPDKLAVLAHNALVITHSAGFLCLYAAILASPDCRPFRIQAVAPPDAVKNMKDLVVATVGPKTTAMYKHAKNLDGSMRDFLHFMGSGAIELASHPIVYGKIISHVTSFNGVVAAQKLAEDGLRVDIFLMKNDHYFSHIDVEEVESDLLHIYRIDGLHDDVAMRSSTLVERIVKVIGDN